MTHAALCLSPRSHGPPWPTPEDCAVDAWTRRDLPCFICAAVDAAQKRLAASLSGHLRDCIGISADDIAMSALREFWDRTALSRYELEAYIRRAARNRRHDAIRNQKAFAEVPLDHPDPGASVVHQAHSAETGASLEEARSKLSDVEDLAVLMMRAGVSRQDIGKILRERQSLPSLPSDPSNRSYANGILYRAVHILIRCGPGRDGFGRACGMYDRYIEQTQNLGPEARRRWEDALTAVFGAHEKEARWMLGGAGPPDSLEEGIRLRGQMCDVWKRCRRIKNGSDNA